MPYRSMHAASAGARHTTIPDFAEITKGKPEKKLTAKVHYRAGRNSQGRITCWHKGGRHARQYRLVDFKRAKLDMVATVSAIEYDPNRNCRIALITYADGEKAILALPSGEIRRVHQDCRATIGLIGRADANVRNIGKAGRNRWLGVRPTVRGNAQNPIAHPLGGGEGHTNGGRQHCSPWALVDGKKTRRKKNRSNVYIIRRRDGRAMTTEA